MVSILPQELLVSGRAAFPGTRFLNGNTRIVDSRSVGSDEFSGSDHVVLQHKSFDQEIKYCSEMFSDGHAHILGPLNGDHWCVFVVDRMQQDSCDMKDQTLNLYMYGINQDIAQLFMKSEQMILPSLFDSKEKTLASGENQLEITKEAGCNTKLIAPCFTFVTSAAEATSRSGINL